MISEDELLLLGQQLNRLIEEKSRPIMTRYGLRKVELEILLFLHLGRHGDTARDIMDSRHISKAHISKSVENLHRRGFLLPEEDPEDHRKVHLRLTGRAAEAAGEFLDVHIQCRNILLSDISREEIGAVDSAVRKMRRNIARTAVGASVRGGRT